MIPAPKLNITSNKMNKDYQNKFAPDIWCLFVGIIFCILTVFVYSYLKMDITIFQFSQNQVTQISKPESCNFYPQNSFNFIRYHDRVLFIVDEESWIKCMQN